MATRMGGDLTDDLVDRLDGHDVARFADTAILIATMGEDGWPHPALLSYFEVAAIDRQHLRLATYGGSRTTANMRRCGIATLVIVDAHIVYYLKGAVRELAPAMRSAPHYAALDFEVRDVLRDHADAGLEAGAFVSSGITYVRPDADEGRVQAWRVLAELVASPTSERRGGQR